MCLESSCVVSSHCIKISLLIIAIQTAEQSAQIGVTSQETPPASQLDIRPLHSAFNSFPTFPKKEGEFFIPASHPPFYVLKAV
jgi:hypothetical protein